MKLWLSVIVLIIIFIFALFGDFLFAMVFFIAWVISGKLDKLKDLIKELKDKRKEK